MHYLYIAVGGAAGAVLRYLVSGWAYALLGTGFPWGTLVVNLIGSFLIGFLWQLFANVPVPPNMRLLIFTGGLGAFTTFSTFAREKAELLKIGDIKTVMVYALTSNVLGVLLVFAGYLLANNLIKNGG